MKPLNGIQRNLTGSKISKSSTKFVFFGLIGKTRWPPQPLIDWNIFDFLSETAERNSTKLDRKEDLNVLYQVCIFLDWSENKMAALGPDWLRHFRLLLWNRWTKFNETWQEARSQRPFPTPVFFRADRKKKLAVMAHDWLRHFCILLWNCWTGFKEIWQEAWYQHLLPTCVFQSDVRVNKDYRPSRSVKKVAHYTQVHDMWPFGPLVYVFIWWRKGGCTYACICIETQSQPLLQNCLTDVYETW